MRSLKCTNSRVREREGRNSLRPCPLRANPGRNKLRSSRCTAPEHPAPPRRVASERRCSVHTTPLRHGSTPDARRMETSICFAMLVAGQDEAYDLIHTATLFRANEPLSANETPPTPFVNRR